MGERGGSTGKSLSMDATGTAVSISDSFDCPDTQSNRSGQLRRMNVSQNRNYDRPPTVLVKVLKNRLYGLPGVD
jgi:hypothetical protein